MSMSMSLNMEVLISEGIKNMVMNVVSKAVMYCGEMNNFDGELMLRNMNIKLVDCLKASKSKPKKSNVNVGSLKEVKMKNKSPFPFNGKRNDNCCSGLRPNHGLYTQCETEVKDSKFCKKCGDSPKFGTIDERLAVGLMEFRDPTGKSPTPYMKVLNKLKISKAEAELEASKLNIVIDDVHFIEENKEKKEKGRPKKAKKIIELEDDSTDLFASLVAKANEESDEELVEYSDDDKVSFAEPSFAEPSFAESIIDSVLDKVNIIVEKNEKETEKEALKLAEKQKKEAEKEALKLAEKEKKEAEKAEKEALKLAEKQKKEAEKAEKEALKLAEKQKKDAEKAEKAEKEALKLAEKQKKDAEKAEKQKKETKVVEKKTEKVVEKESEKKKKDEDEEEDVVKRFEFEGVKYLKSKKTGIIYNMEQDVIGKWNEKTNKIDFEEQDSEEEEEEYDE